MTSEFYAGFEALLTVGEDDYDRLFATGLIIPDTNVLLNLYRYSQTARENLLSVLDGIKERLWIPHRVLEEFWKNREAVLRDPQDIRLTLSLIEEHGEAIDQGIRAWSNRVSLRGSERDRILEELSSALEQLSKKIGSFTDAAAEKYSSETGMDGILAVLARVFHGRIGRDFEEKEREAATAEAIRRIEYRIPPGYKDKAKGDSGRVGDYFVWRQVLDYVSKNPTDVLLVTGDLKEDWWRKEQGEWRGARLELAQEFQKSTGKNLTLIRPSTFLQQAQRILGIAVGREAFQNVDLLEQLKDTDLPGMQFAMAAETLESLRTKSPEEVDALVAAILVSRGYDSISLLSQRPLGSDFVAHSSRHSDALVMVKRTNSLTKDLLAKQLGKMELDGFINGVIATTATISETVRELAATRPELLLLDGQDLMLASINLAEGDR